MKTTKNKTGSWHSPKQLWIMIFSGILFLVSACVCAGMTNTVYPFFAALRGWDYSALVMMSGIAMLISVITGLLFGQLVVKIGFKPVMIAGLLCAAVVVSVLGSTTSLGIFILCIILSNVFATAYQNVGVSALINTWFPRTKGIVLGWSTMGIILSDVLWTPNITKPMAAVGTGTTFLIVGVVFVVLAIICALFVKSTPEQAGTYPDGNSEGIEDLQASLKAFKEYKSPWTLGKVLKTKQTWQVTVGLGLFWLIAICYISQIVPRCLSLGHSEGFANTVMAVGGLFGLIGSWFFGFLDQKMGTKKASQIYGIWIFVMFILTLFHAVSPVFIWISQAGIMACIGGICNLIPSMVGTIWGRWDFAAANRVINPFTLAFCAIGIFMGGIFLNVGLGYNVMYTVCAVLAVIGFIIITTLKADMLGKK